MSLDHKDACIVSQIHIPPFDPQGRLIAEDKIEIIDTTISQLRALNPNSYIILVGHGLTPHKKTISKCDHFIWEDLHSIDGGGTVTGMPAQYKSVSKGVKAAKERGFKYCLKTRGDSLVGKRDIISYCHQVISEEQKKILLTQQTGRSLYKFGDCFMYGEMDLIDSIWDLNNHPFHNDGLRHTGASFVKHFTGQFPPKEYDQDRELFNGMNWEQMLREYASFRNLTRFNFCDLRWNYNDLKGPSWNSYREKMLNNTYDYSTIWWGTKNGWHIFDSDGNLEHNNSICSWAYCEKDFYVWPFHNRCSI